MKKKRLVILKVNTILFDGERVEAMRKQVKKQLKDNVIAIDKGVGVECIDYDGKELEVVVISKDDNLVIQNKEEL